MHSCTGEIGMAEGSGGRGIVLGCVLAAFWSAARAGEDGVSSLPLPSCATASSENCVAHLFVSDADRERRSCFPARYLELWDGTLAHDQFLKREEAGGDYRRVGGAECAIPEGFLEPLKGRMAHLDPQRDPNREPRRPEWGVALEGGGSKSAPFALGVLAGLYQSGVLQRTDVVASVSGGSYAAHYYFSRLIDDWEAGHPAGRDGDPAWFRDCIPYVYHEQFSAAAGAEIVPRFCSVVEPPKWGQTGKVADCPLWEVSRCPSGEAQKPASLGDAHAYWEQPLHYADLIYPIGSWRRVGGASEWAGTLTNVLGLLGAHVLTLPAHHLAHTVFSWPENFSPSREAYRSGIERAYGHTTRSWQEAMDWAPDWNPPAAEGAAALPPEHPGWRDPAEPLRRRGSHTLARLGVAFREAQKHCLAGEKGSDGAPLRACGFPLWIIGSANSAGRSFDSWLTVPARDSLRVLFETTPLSQGSGTYGWADQPFGAWLMRDAAGASAAFADDEQRLVREQPGRLFLSGLLHLLNANWGTDIPNYGAGDDRRTLYRFMFWPLYTLPPFQGREAPYIHLSDGGNTDNLALLSLLRRGVKNIVVAASTDDAVGQFPSLCEAKNQLELDGSYRLLMPELQGFDRVCAEQLNATQLATWGEARVKAYYCSRVATVPLSGSACDARWANRPDELKFGYDLWRWPIPALQGCVVTDQPGESASCEAGGAKLISRLFVVKPAINRDRAGQQLSPLPARNPQGNDHGLRAPVGDGDHAKSAGSIRYCPGSAPGDVIGTRPGAADPMEMPCTSLAFWVANEGRNGIYGHFPQHEFKLITLNSSYTLFSAYFDLARHYARQIPVSGTVAWPSSPGIVPCLISDRRGGGIEAGAGCVFAAAPTP